MAKQHSKRAPIIQALLIDPFKQCIQPLNVSSRDFDERWCWLLSCEHFERVVGEINQSWHAVWVDEAGLLRDPVPFPQFTLEGFNGGSPLTGYGLLTGLDSMLQEITPPRINGHTLMAHVKFENWGNRLKPDDYLDQLLRLYLAWP